MSSTSSLLSYLQQLLNFEIVLITNGHPCLITGKGMIKPTSSLSLSNVLYIQRFLVNLLSISALTKTLFSHVKFFPYHCIFQDFQMGMRIALGQETRWGLYELVSNSPFPSLSSLFSHKSSSPEWYRHLGNLGISKLF